MVVQCLEVGSLPVRAGHHAAAVGGTTGAVHAKRVVVRDDAVGAGDLVARCEIAAGGEPDWAGEPRRRIAAVVGTVGAGAVGEHEVFVVIERDGVDVGAVKFGLREPLVELGGRDRVAPESQAPFRPGCCRW